MTQDNDDSNSSGADETDGEAPPPRERMIETQQEMAAQLTRIADALESDT